MAWDAFISGGLGLAGSLASAALSAEQAAKQRKFQERMYKHRYRYTMADMEKAGLNPILMQPGVGSAPAGAMGQVPDLGQNISRGMTSAAAAKQARTASAVGQSTVNLQSAQAGAADAQAAAANSAAGLNAQNAAGRMIENEMNAMRLETWKSMPERVRRAVEASRHAGGGVSGAAAGLSTSASDLWEAIKGWWNARGAK